MPTKSNMGIKYCIPKDLTIKLSFESKDTFLVGFGKGSSRQEICISTNAFKLITTLLTLNRPLSAESLTKKLTTELDLDKTNAQLLINDLIDKKLLINVKEAVVSKDDVKWDDWGWRDAYDLHTATQDMVWVHDYKGKKEKPPIMTYRHTNILIEPDRPKPLRKSIKSKDSIKLLKPSNQAEKVSYNDALYSRRTFRNFSDQQVTLQEISDVLHLVSQPILYEGSRPFRPTPTYSLGHFYSLYVVINNVEKVKPGVYFYDESTHSLLLIKKGDYSKELIKLTQSQPFLKNASFGLFVSVHWDQYMWKYRFSRAYRLALFEIAGIVQTLLIICAGLKLKTFLTPAIADSEVSQLLKIQDMYKECPLYVIGVGKE